jgi:hypothetical protein
MEGFYMKITSFINIRTSTENNKIEKKDINGEMNDTGFESLGMKKTSENLSVYKVLTDNNISPTKEMIENIKGIFQKTSGTLEEKINSLDILLKKDIEITAKNFKIMHQSLTKNIDYNELFDILDKYFKEEEVDYDKLFKTIGLSEKVINQFLLLKVNNLSLKDSFMEIYDNSNISLSETEKEIISTIINDEDNNNKPIEIESQILEMFDDFEKNIDEVIYEIGEDAAYEINEIINTDNFRNFLVETTTKEMINVKNEFKVFKSENLKLIDQIVIDLDENKKPESSDLLKVIDNFEKVIMKSDITLYTSMKQEKELIKLASKLELAKEYLDDNNQNKAKSLLKEVKKELDKINFEPKDIKVKSFMKKEANKILFNEKSNYKDVYNTFSKKNKGVREVLEVLRATGINHDSEMVQKIEKSDFNKLEISNLKDIVLNVMKANEGKVLGELKNVVNNVTGNQFQNKLEVKSNIQQMHLSIPYEVNSKIQSLDLYIKSKKENEKIDWKNSTLYFVINLKKYGETGIRISATNKVVNMNVKNDSDTFKNVSKDMFDIFLEDLAKEGFIKGKVNYSAFTDNSNEKLTSNAIGVNISDNGFDVKI